MSWSHFFNSFSKLFADSSVSVNFFFEKVTVFNFSELTVKFDDEATKMNRISQNFCY